MKCSRFQCQPACRRSRPLCRWRRNGQRCRDTKHNQVVCNCGGYHFPHRRTSKLCQHNPTGNAAVWAELDKPRRVRA